MEQVDSQTEFSSRTTTIIFILSINYSKDDENHSILSHGVVHMEYNEAYIEGIVCPNFQEHMAMKMNIFHIHPRTQNCG